MRHLLSLVLLILSLTIVTPLYAQESSNTAADEESGNVSCTQEQTDQGQPIGLCTFDNGCTGYSYYQYAPKASEKYGEIRCVPSVCSEPIVQCPPGVTKPTEIPAAPSGKIEGTTAVEGIDFQLAADRLTGHDSSCKSVLGIFDQAQSAYSVWQGLNYGTNCPGNIGDSWTFLSSIVAKQGNGLVRDFLPEEPPAPSPVSNPIRRVLDAFLGAFKNLLGI